MVATRRSRRLSSDADQEAAESSKDMGDAVREEEPTPEPSRKPPRRSTFTRKKRKEELKWKNTGLGLSISIDSNTKKNKKIVFDDDEDLDQTIDEKDNEKLVETPPGEADGDEDDNDDDAVEEVKGSAAREEMMAQLQAEEKGALKPKKSRKRKERQKDEDDDDLDEDFFAQLETVKAEEEKEKQAKKKKKRQGKHTTFVFNEGDNTTSSSEPKKVGHNIQVVVLPDQGDALQDDSLAGISTTLSGDALMYSRGSLHNGSDGGPKKKSRKSPNRPDTTWKRSRKMNLVLTSQSRFHRRGGKGRPAANFASKKIKR